MNETISAEQLAEWRRLAEADKAVDLLEHYAWMERTRPSCDSEWCPFLNPSREMNQWQAAIRRAIVAEAEVDRLRRLIPHNAALCDEEPLSPEAEKFLHDATLEQVRGLMADRARLQTHLDAARDMLAAAMANCPELMAAMDKTLQADNDRLRGLLAECQGVMKFTAESFANVPMMELLAKLEDEPCQK